MTDCATCDTCSGGVYDFCLTRHELWTRTFRIVTDGSPMDLTGATIEMPILVAPDPVLLLSVGDGIVISVPETDGVFTVTLTADQTYALPAGGGSYEVWVNSQRLLSGALTVCDTIWAPPP